MELRNLSGLIGFFLILWSCNPSSQNQENGSSIQLKPKTGIIEVGNTFFEYRIAEGEGKIPCLAPGAVQHVPGVISEKLKKQLKFIHCGDRGVNSDSMAINSITLDTIIDDMELLRKELNLGKVAVYGHSIFGLIALEYGRKYPKNTSHIIVIGSPISTGEALIGIQKEYWESVATDERKKILHDRRESMKDSLSKVSPEKRFLLSYITDAPRYWYNPNYDCSWIWKDAKPPNMNWIGHLFGTIFKDYTIDWTPNMVGSPVFVALGKYDFAVPPTIWEETNKETLSNVKIELFEKSGHWPFFEEQELFDEKVIAWMDSIE